MDIKYYYVEGNDWDTNEVSPRKRKRAELILRQLSLECSVVCVPYLQGNLCKAWGCTILYATEQDIVQARFGFQLYELKMGVNILNSIVSHTSVKPIQMTLV